MDRDDGDRRVPERRLPATELRLRVIGADDLDQLTIGQWPVDQDVIGDFLFRALDRALHVRHLHDGSLS